MVALSLALSGIALVVMSATDAISPTAGFFGAGGAWLVAGLCGTSAWLRRGRTSRPFGRGVTAIRRSYEP